MGFPRVYDYVTGKLDWLAAGFPTEGTNAARARAGDVARRDVPTCGLADRVGEVQEQVRAAGWDACVVLNPERVVLGLLRAEELQGPPESRIDAVMRPGPSTFRSFVLIGEIARFMSEHDLPSSPITTSDGRLVGLLRRTDAERAVQEGRG